MGGCEEVGAGGSYFHQCVFQIISEYQQFVTKRLLYKKSAGAEFTYDKNKTRTPIQLSLNAPASTLPNGPDLRWREGSLCPTFESASQKTKRFTILTSVIFVFL